MAKRYNEKRAAMAQAGIDKELDEGYGKINFESSPFKLT